MNRVASPDDGSQSGSTARINRGEQGSMLSAVLDAALLVFWILIGDGGSGLLVDMGGVLVG